MTRDEWRRYLDRHDRKQKQAAKKTTQGGRKLAPNPKGEQTRWKQLSKAKR